MKISMLATENTRTWKYLEACEELGVSIGTIVLLKKMDGKGLPGQKEEDLESKLQSYAQARGISIIEVDTASKERHKIASREILGLEEQLILTSLPGGFILSPDYFIGDKQYLHAHAGWLPEYKGSTTIYYQYLEKKECGCSAIFLTEELDSGPVICRKKFPFNSLDVDYEYDAWVRAETIKEALGRLKGEQNPVEFQQVPDEGRLFYIIHPFLRHVAKLALEKEVGSGEIQ